ncbi:hypothetical protein, partial [Paenibacillus sp. DMB5]|uniref:hypothetical protein n=1 Tax=Paenibacillus sp. DMB5 TaxID=1780103 RepID=UPI001A7E17E1
FEIEVNCLFLELLIVRSSHFAHKKIPSIVDRLNGLLFSVYYRGIISKGSGPISMDNPLSLCP